MARPLFSCKPREILYASTPWEVWAIGWIAVIQGVFWLFTPEIVPGTKGEVLLGIYLVQGALFLAFGFGAWNRRLWGWRGLAALSLAAFCVHLAAGIHPPVSAAMNPLLLAIYLFFRTLSGWEGALLLLALLGWTRKKYFLPASVEEAPLDPAPSKGREWAEAFLFALIFALLLRTFVVQAFKIPSGSMEDTLLVGDHLLVNKFAYGTRLPITGDVIFDISSPDRGDIIVFEYPLDRELTPFERRDFIKRVIGTPGDRVKMVEQVVHVNGEPFRIPQEIHKGPQGPSTGLLYNFDEMEVPPGHYFVMGDNRDRSSDSRFWGFVPEQNIRGKAFIKYWSWDSEGALLQKIRWSRLGRPIR